jgi:hypothetical protein
MPLRIYLFVLLAALCVAEDCAPQPLEPGLVRAVTQVSAGAGGATYGLAPGSCVEGRCALVIQLLSSGKLLDFIPLDFAASEPALTREEGNNGLAGFTPVEAWTAGSEEGAVTTALQSVRLTPARNGLLVHQAAGFEHVKRRHDLFVADAGKLERVWSAAEGAGPAWSAAEVVPSGKGRADEIIYLQGFRPGGAEADTLTARRLVWDDKRQKLVIQPLAMLPAVTAGEFSSVKTARRAAASSCLNEYWVLPANRFGGAASKFVLALVAVRKQTVEAEMARPCEARPARRMAKFRPLGPAK